MAATEKSLSELVNKLKNSTNGDSAAKQAEGAMRDLKRIVERERLSLKLLETLHDGLKTLNPKRAHTYIKRDLEKVISAVHQKLSSARQEEEAKRRAHHQTHTQQRPHAPHPGKPGHGDEEAQKPKRHVI